MPCKGGVSAIFFCYRKGSSPQRIMILQAAVRGWGFAKDGRGVLGHLDQFGRDQGVEPHEVGKHLFDLLVLHDGTFFIRSIINCRAKKMGTFILFRARSVMRAMSYLEKITKKEKDANPFFCLMGIDVIHVEAGKAQLSMEIRPDMWNGVGWLQGGLFTALADEAMALALYPLLSANEGIATISESTSFIRGAREGTLIAEGRVIKKGHRVAFAEGEVFTGDDEKTMLSRTSAAFAVTINKN